MVNWTADGSSPAVDAVAITPNDSTDLTRPPKAIYVGTGGNVALIPRGQGASVVTFANVQDGTILPVSTRRVNATDTTALNIVGLY